MVPDQAPGVSEGGGGQDKIYLRIIVRQ